MKKSLAVIGSCCSRDIFNKQFIPEWKEFFDLQIDGFANSIVSLMSYPIMTNRNIKRKDISAIGKWAINYYFESERSIINGIVSSQPDIILLDFQADAAYGVYKVEKDAYLTKAPQKRWQGVTGFEQLNLGVNEWLSVFSDYDYYMDLFYSSLDNFISFIKKECPNSLIILNSVHFSNEIQNEDGSITEFNHNDAWITVRNKKGELKKINGKERFIIESKAIDEMNEFAQKRGLVSINHEKQFINPNYSFSGPGIVHFFKPFYRYTFEEIIRLSDEYCLNNPNSIEVKNQNLLSNGDFSHNSLFWDKWDNSFRINKEAGNSLAVEESNKVIEQYHQVWSSPVMTKLGINYTVSFETNIHSMDTEVTKPIFEIRLFDKQELYTSKDSVKEYKILPYENYEKGEFQKYTFTFKAETRFFRVGCYMLKNGYIEWKNISVVRGDREIDSFTKSVMENILLKDKRLNDINYLYL